MSSLANFKLPDFMNFEMTSTMQMGLIGVIAIIIIFLMYYVFFTGDKDSSSMDEEGSIPDDEMYSESELMEGMESGNKQAEVLFFFADWCPHCKKAKPIVQEVKNKYDKQTINNHSIRFTYVDCTNETQESKRLLEQYEIEGFPTLLLKVKNNVTKYEESPTKSDLSNFIEKTLENSV